MSLNLLPAFGNHSLASLQYEGRCLVLFQLNIPCLVDIPGGLALFRREMRSGLGLGVREGTGRKGETAVRM